MDRKTRAIFQTKAMNSALHQACEGYSARLLSEAFEDIENES